MDKRLIDRWALFPNGVFFVNEKNPMASIDELINRIWSAPTVDAVEVVRCKDCTWYDEDGCCVNSHCTKSYYGCHVPQQHFCSYGERRTDE